MIGYTWNPFALKVMLSLLFMALTVHGNQTFAVQMMKSGFLSKFTQYSKRELHARYDSKNDEIRLTCKDFKDVILDKIETDYSKGTILLKLTGEKGKKMQRFLQIKAAEDTSKTKGAKDLLTFCIKNKKDKDNLYEGSKPNYVRPSSATKRSVTKRRPSCAAESNVMSPVMRRIAFRPYLRVRIQNLTKATKFNGKAGTLLPNKDQGKGWRKVRVDGAGVIAFKEKYLAPIGVMRTLETARQSSSPSPNFEIRKVKIALDNDECLGNFTFISILHQLHLLHKDYNTIRNGKYGDSRRETMIANIVKYYLPLATRPRLKDLFHRLQELKTNGKVDEVHMYTSAFNTKGYILFLKDCLETFAGTPGLYDNVFSRDMMENVKEAKSGGTKKDLLNVASKSKIMVGEKETIDEALLRKTSNVLMFDDKPQNIKARHGIAAGVSDYRDMPSWDDVLDLINANPGFKKYLRWQYRGLGKFEKAMKKKDGCRAHYDRTLWRDMKDDETVSNMIKQVNAFVQMCHAPVPAGARKQCPKCYGRSAADPEMGCNHCNKLGKVLDLTPDQSRLVKLTEL